MLNTGALAGKTIFITGASRGIGKAIALKAARDGANIVVAAKTNEPHPKLPGTIHSAAAEIEAAGGRALPQIVDVRSEESVQRAVDATVERFGGIDVLVNNASAIQLTSTLDTSMKRYDLMHAVNARGTFLTSRLCLPYLRQARSPHIVVMAPPLNMSAIWFSRMLAYTMAKYGMSMCVLGLADEFRGQIGVNALWPRTLITTAATEMLTSGTTSSQGRTPQIVADAFYAIVTRDASNCTGNFFIDDDVLREFAGVDDFSQYLDKGATEESLMPDLFLEEAEKMLSTAGSAMDMLDNKKASVGGVPHIFSKLAKQLAKADAGGEEKIVFDLGSEGTWHIDLGKCKAGSGPIAEPDATITMEADDFVRLFVGQLSGAEAVMSGKLKVEGDMSAALRLQSITEKIRP